MTELNCLKEDIENLSKFHQIEILKLLKSDSSCTLNENKNGIFVNMTNLNKPIIEEIRQYLLYVTTQEKQLNDVEDKKEVLSTTYFNDVKDNKDNTSISVNASSTI
ncbi:hypothetical protein N8261_04995 [Flavobacteriaceae bacterium]|nr:hypothetical protein [Flavobacteriaceae bacterium]